MRRINRMCLTACAVSLLLIGFEDTASAKTALQIVTGSGEFLQLQQAIGVSDATPTFLQWTTTASRTGSILLSAGW
jgi:hypothetical protein